MGAGAAGLAWLTFASASRGAPSNFLVAAVAGSVENRDSAKWMGSLPSPFLQRHFPVLSTQFVRRVAPVSIALTLGIFGASIVGESPAKKRDPSRRNPP